jgi:hypothetical protein
MREQPLAAELTQLEGPAHSRPTPTRHLRDLESNIPAMMMIERYTMVEVDKGM